LIYVFYSRKHYEKEVYYEKDQFLPTP
jgi:hypothetical protein